MRYLLLLLLIVVGSCNSRYTIHNSCAKVIIVQPFNDFSPALTKNMLAKLKEINPQIILAPSVALPASAYYQPRNRYRADSLLKFLNRYKNNDTVVAGITHWDISTTKNAYGDWGVMGLGYRPGNACVISTHRLNKNNIQEQFYKVVIHELGHTEGLPHCTEQTCFMRNANGGNPLDEETDFCPSCKAFLKGKGWNLK